MVWLEGTWCPWSTRFAMDQGWLTHSPPPPFSTPFPSVSVLDERLERENKDLRARLKAMQLRLEEGGEGSSDDDGASRGAGSLNAALRERDAMRDERDSLKVRRRRGVMLCVWVMGVL